VLVTVGEGVTDGGGGVSKGVPVGGGVKVGVGVAVPVGVGVSGSHGVLVGVGSCVLVGVGSTVLVGVAVGVGVHSPGAMRNTDRIRQIVVNSCIGAFSKFFPIFFSTFLYHRRCNCCDKNLNLYFNTYSGCIVC